MELKRKTFTLSDNTIYQIDTIVTKSIQKDLHLTESTLVRLALAEGLPIVAEKLNLKEVKSNDQREITLV
jgi:hypothetical protein